MLSYRVINRHITSLKRVNHIYITRCSVSFWERAKHNINPFNFRLEKDEGERIMERPSQEDMDKNPALRQAWIEQEERYGLYGLHNGSVAIAEYRLEVDFRQTYESGISVSLLCL